MNLVKLGDTVWISFYTANPSTGARQDADSTPVVLVYANGAQLPYLPSVGHISSGGYQAAVVCTTGNGFAAGQQCHVDCSVIVAGIAGADTIGQLNIQSSQMDDVNTLATLMLKLMRNKFVTNPVTGMATVYDDNGVVLLQGQIYEDAAGTQPYRGQGAERRERMT